MFEVLVACSDSCAIDDGEEVVLTGGLKRIRKKNVIHHSYTYFSESTVTRYNIQGEATPLPSLNIGRNNHACGIIKKSDGSTVRTSQRWIRMKLFATIYLL